MTHLGEANLFSFCGSKQGAIVDINSKDDVDCPDCIKLLNKVTSNYERIVEIEDQISNIQKKLDVKNNAKNYSNLSRLEVLAAEKTNCLPVNAYEAYIMSHLSKEKEFIDA